MAARDRFELALHCKACNISGTADVSEEDHPWMRHPGFGVDSIPDDFRVTKASNYRQTTEIICVRCGTLVHPQAA
ncbi:hypothetical protein [Brevundimonas sp.]|uniref:hypothetical protein n=1 Tax=Brevundimonas sp. TaxID=1871086 RepID=UPI0028AB37D0|nr:hypothetical protein [Brevundimonas sp.]